MHAMILTFDEKSDIIIDEIFFNLQSFYKSSDAKLIVGVKIF